MNRLNDLEINCAVRKVLVRHWVDLGRICLRTTAGVAYLSGELMRLPKVGSPLTSSSVTEMINEIRRSTGARRVQADFVNWVECGGVWKHAAPKPTDVQDEIAKDKATGVYDLSRVENPGLTQPNS